MNPPGTKNLSPSGFEESSLFHHPRKDLGKCGNSPHLVPNQVDQMLIIDMFEIDWDLNCASYAISTRFVEQFYSQI